MSLNQCSARSDSTTLRARTSRRLQRLSHHARLLQIAAVTGAMLTIVPAVAGLTITPTFTANFNANFGANAAAAQASWISAANIFSSDFSDNIHVNLTVDAVAGTGVFGQSNTFLNSLPYSTMRNLLVADATTVNDAVSISAAGSVAVTDPTGGAGTWWVTRAQAKAIGFIPDDLSTDGTTTFGAGNPFTFSGPITAGTYDFKGVAAHEISEVMGRLGISGGTIGSFANSYSLIDDFAYSGLNTRKLTDGANDFFSMDNGATLLKLWNNAAVNGLDTKDWAAGTNDSFNQFSNSGVVNPVTPLDLQLMDVIGYDLTVVPEPGTLGLLAAGTLMILKRRSRKVVAD